MLVYPDDSTINRSFDFEVIYRMRNTETFYCYLTLQVLTFHTI
jgi:hypothetical protein